MVEIKTVMIVAAVYYFSWLVAQYNKFKGISVEHINDTTFWRVLVWIAWFLMPLILPLIVAIHLIIETHRKVCRAFEDNRRCKYSLKDGRTPRRYRHGHR
jgi:hypothetical protein